VLINNPNIGREANTSTFVHFMNYKAEQLGLTQTYFLNPTGLDENGTVSGGYGSAKDVAVLMSYILKHYPSLLVSTTQEKITVSSLDNRKIGAQNTNSVVSTIPGIIASKTGLTDLAGGNLAIAFDASFGEPFIVVVLGSTEEGRFTDVQKLVAATIDYLGQRNQIVPQNL
jgi:D-alanyl-D-alanine carboxypeptidase